MKENDESTDWLAGIGLLGLAGLISIPSIIKQKKKQKAEQEEFERQLEAARKEREEKELEEKLRQGTVFAFKLPITEQEFVSIVNTIAKPIKRLHISVEGPIVYGTIRTQSGISTWNFKLDFNDYGDLTGKYWLSQENYDSDLPQKFARTIQEEIKRRL